MNSMAFCRGELCLGSLRQNAQSCGPSRQVQFSSLSLWCDRVSYQVHTSKTVQKTVGEGVCTFVHWYGLMSMRTLCTLVHWYGLMRMRTLCLWRPKTDVRCLPWLLSPLSIHAPTAGCLGLSTQASCSEESLSLPSKC